MFIGVGVQDKELLNFLKGSISKGTQDRYKSLVAEWERYVCDRFPTLKDWSASSLPLQRRAVASYIMHLRKEKGFSMSKINGSLAAVRFHCLVQFVDLDVWTDPVVSAARRAATRQVGVEQVRKRSVNFKYPVPLELLLQSREMYMKGSLETRMTYVACRLAYHLMMRVSEFAVTASKSPHHLLCEDVEFMVAGQVNYIIAVDAKRFSHLTCLGVLIHIWSSKTDQKRKGCTHVLRGDGLSPVLEKELVQDIWTFACQSGSGKGEPFFRRYENGRGKSLRRKEVAHMVKEIMSRAGEDPQRFSTRSLRSGGATTLDSKGVAENTTNKLGRWAKDSAAAKIYRGSLAVAGGALSSDTAGGAVFLERDPFSSRDLRRMNR